MPIKYHIVDEINDNIYLKHWDAETGLVTAVVSNEGDSHEFETSQARDAVIDLINSNNDNAEFESEQQVGFIGHIPPPPRH